MVSTINRKPWDGGCLIFVVPDKSENALCKRSAYLLSAREAGRRAGHSAEKLIVGFHAIGFLENTTQDAAGDFYPGYAHTFTEIGKERGWPPATRAQFDALRGPTGALLIGDAETIAEKILYVSEVLGGLSRITFQMGVSALPHEKMLRSIELLGTGVAPVVRKELTTVSSH